MRYIQPYLESLFQEAPDAQELHEIWMKHFSKPILDDVFILMNGRWYRWYYRKSKSSIWDESRITEEIERAIEDEDLESFEKVEGVIPFMEEFKEYYPELEKMVVFWDYPSS